MTPPPTQDRPKPRRYRRWAKVSLALCSTLFTFIACEFWARTRTGHPYAAAESDRIVRLRLYTPGMSLDVNRSEIDPKNPSVQFRVDRRGYITNGPSTNNADLRLAFFGGSTTACVSVSESLRFPFLVSCMIEKERGVTTSTIVAAKSGNALHDSINILFNQVITEKPNIAVVMHACNDIAILGRGNEYQRRMASPMTSSYALSHLLKLSSQYSALAGILRYKYAFPTFSPSEKGFDYTEAVVGVGPYQSRLNVFVDMCRAFGIHPILVTQPLAAEIRNELTPDWAFPTAQNVFNEAIRHVGQEKGVKVIDLARSISNNYPKKEDLRRIFYDGMHVTDEGSRIYSDIIASGLIEYLHSGSPIATGLSSR